MFSSNQFFSVVYFLFRKSQWTQAIRRRRGAFTFFIIGFFLAKDQETRSYFIGGKQYVYIPHV